MDSTRAGLALLGVALALSIHGCALDSFKPSVQIAIGKQCGDAASAVANDHGLGKLKNMKVCHDLDKDKLKDFGVTGCPAILHGLISTAMEMECMGSVAESAVEACGEVTADCKSAVDDGVKEWKPEEPPVDKEEEMVEKEGGEEALLYLLQSCEKISKDRAKKSTEIVDACDSTKEGGPNADFMKIMDVDADDCAVQAAGAWVLAHSAMCLIYVSFHAELPEDPKDLTKEFLDSEIGHFWSDLDDAVEEVEKAMEPPAERLRLYQSTIKAMKWPRKAAKSMGKILIFGSASAVALMALVVVVRRRRSQQSVPLDEEMLITDE